MGYIEQLIGQIALQQTISSSDHPSAEHLLNALLSLIRDHEESQRICKRPELQFQSTLSCILESSAGKEEYQVGDKYL